MEFPDTVTAKTKIPVITAIFHKQATDGPSGAAFPQPSQLPSRISKSLLSRISKMGVHNLIIILCLFVKSHKTGDITDFQQHIIEGDTIYSFDYANQPAIAGPSDFSSVLSVGGLNQSAFLQGSATTVTFNIVAPATVGAPFNVLGRLVNGENFTAIPFELSVGRPLHNPKIPTIREFCFFKLLFLALLFYLLLYLYYTLIIDID